MDSIQSDRIIELMDEIRTRLTMQLEEDLWLALADPDRYELEREYRRLGITPIDENRVGTR